MQMLEGKRFGERSEVRPMRWVEGAWGACLAGGDANGALEHAIAPLLASGPRGDLVESRDNLERRLDGCATAPGGMDLDAHSAQMLEDYDPVLAKELDKQPPPDTATMLTPAA